MKLLEIKDLKNYYHNSCITIGFFDGLHKGHQAIFKKLVDESKKNNLKSVVISFDESVLDLFKMCKNITSLNEKLESFNYYDVDYVLLLKTSDNFMGLSADEFINNYLEKLHTKEVICGSDFSFAKNKEGNIKYLLAHTNYEVISVNDVYINDDKISSTYIRNLLTIGEIKKANSLLFKDFTISSKVINGKKIGRTIGFKTANIKITPSCELLKIGVYYGIVIIDNKKYKAMINVGYNPTVNIDKKLKVEAHILNFKDEIYDKDIKIIFKIYHREEKSFASLEDLKNQLEMDVKMLDKEITL